MVNYFIKKYLLFIFITSTLIGVFHHHNDLKIHNDCQICTIQSTISNADTPVEVLYFTNLDIAFGIITKNFKNLHSKTLNNTNYARAPPVIS